MSEIEMAEIEMAEIEMAEIEMTEKETQTDFSTIKSNDLIPALIANQLSKAKSKDFFLKLFDFLNRLRLFVLNNLMIILIIIAASLGVGIAFILKEYAALTDDQKNYFSFPGELFVRALKFISLPLIVCNLITGMSGLAHKSKLIGLRTFYFYSVSILTSTAVGFLVVLTIRPGSRANVTSSDLQQFESDSPEKFNNPISISSTILDVFRNLIPGLYNYKN